MSVSAFPPGDGAACFQARQKGAVKSGPFRSPLHSPVYVSRPYPPPPPFPRGYLRSIPRCAAGASGKTAPCSPAPAHSGTPPGRPQAPCGTPRRICLSLLRSSRAAVQFRRRLLTGPRSRSFPARTDPRIPRRSRRPGRERCGRSASGCPA